MKYDMEEELDSMPHPKKGMDESEDSEEGEDKELDQAMQVIQRKADEKGISVEDLISSKSSGEQKEGKGIPDPVEEADEESRDLADGHGVGKKEGSPEKSKKLALYIAQMRSKRG
jgi:hypothetical protein